MNSFAEEGKYDLTNVPGAQITQDYEEKRTDAWSVIENFNIIKRIISVCASFHFFPPYWYIDIPRSFLSLLPLKSCDLEYLQTNTSAAKLVQASRQNSLARSPSVATTSSAGTSVRSPPPSSAATFKKAPPPPPSAASLAPPPPYTPATSRSSGALAAAAAAAVKRAPPPPPPLKPKPKLAPKVQYVIALYDFAAQVG